MAFHQLEINKFSKEGEVLRKIRCLAGRVTVFRSQSDAELDKFKRALEGKPQSDRFSVLLDGGSFVPQKQIFIGFGALDTAPPQTTVGSFLIDAGIRDEVVENVLAPFGLGGLSQLLCPALAAPQWKALRLIAAIHAPEASRVIILNEPFDEIPDSFKDPFAERLAKFAWEKQAIIIVTKLSYRPAVWIENDYIARVQLERPRQGTIGFGGGESAVAEHLSTLRKEHGAPATNPGTGPSGPDLLAPFDDRGSALLSHLESPRVVGLTLCLLTVIFGSFYYFWQTSTPLGSEHPGELRDSLHSSTTLNSTTGSQGEKNSKGLSTIDAVSNAARPGSPILEGYPETIRLAWIAAIEHPLSLLRPNQGAAVNLNNEKPSWSGGGDLGDSPIEALYNELLNNR